MKFKSALLSQASGSVGGATWSRNKGGMYVRSRSLVVTPKTAQQLIAQTAMATLATRWQTLTALRRAAWRTFALNVPVLNRLGDSRVIPELAMYVRYNSPRLQFLGAVGVIDDAPTTFSAGVLSPVTFTIAHPHTITVNFTNTDAWAMTNNGYLFVQSSRPCSPTVIFPQGNLRFAGHLDGNTALPPVSPLTVTSAFDCAIGQKVFCRFTASGPDGRLSAPQTLSAIAT